MRLESGFILKEYALEMAKHEDVLMLETFGWIGIFN